MEYVTDIFDIPICTIALHTATWGRASASLPNEGRTCYLWGSEPRRRLETHRGPWMALGKCPAAWARQDRRSAVSAPFPEEQEQNSYDLWTPFQPPLTWDGTLQGKSS